MAQVAPEWEEVPEYVDYAKQIIEKYPDRFAHIDPSLIVAYICTNKTKPESKAKLYDLSGAQEPEAFTNTKRYFVKMFHDTWEALPEANRLALIFSALERIDRETGKVNGYDLHDQALMARTFGVDWALRGGIPNLLRDEIEFKEEPIVS